MIGKRYNQKPHLTKDTTWESNKNTTNITNKSQEVNPQVTTRQTRKHEKHKTQMIHKRSTYRFGIKFINTVNTLKCAY